MELRQFPLAKLRRGLYVALLVIGVACVSGGLGVASVVGFQVFYGNDAELEKSTILARMNEETTIYSQDGSTLFGSFFDNAHRRYVPIEEVPAHMIRAVVAAEDKNFYEHIGIDPPAIVKAFLEGVSHGFHWRRGASTITQQTVKNIMDKREHSFTRKFKEWVRALQLERMYSKAQILEFYLNQFHVTSNGNGIGIAAKYYFNKEVSDLNLVEAAFIAGSVKAPSKYNPFLRYTKDAREKAWEEADQRKNYVLRRMLEQNWITKAEYDQGIKMRVPFNQGKFRTQEVALVSLIRGQMKRKEIMEALGLENDEDLNNAGLKVYTTLDADMQKEAQLMMRRDLSRLDLILDGFKTNKETDFKPHRQLELNEFYFGKVLSINSKDKEPSIKVDFGLPKGVIPYESIVRTAKILSLPTYRPEKQHVAEILKAVKPGDILFVEVKEYNSSTHEAVLEMRKQPKVNGGLIAVDKGEVRAVVSGFDSQGFNRAVFATRQPGSVFKSMVFFGGLQMGWTIVDRLDNERRLFPFQGQFYYPRPDHLSPYSEVSMVWAGTKSENLATIYLTANLLEKLNFEQFKALMGFMDLLPKNGEAPRDFHYRVARATGVQLDNEGVKEYLLKKAITDLKPDLIFSGRLKLLRQLDKMYWGRGYQAELMSLYQVRDEDLPDGERPLRVDLVRNNYARMNALSLSANDDWAAIKAKAAQSGVDGAFNDPATQNLMSRFRVMQSTGAKPSLGYFRTLPGEEPPVRRDGSVYTPALLGRSMTVADAQAVWGDAGLFGESAGIAINDVLLQGYLPLTFLNRIKQNLEASYQQVMAHEEKYDLEQYYNHHDFRIVLGLKYLVSLARAMGVTSPLSPVLSFGLGTNDVSAAEVAKVYQTFVDGKTYKFYKEGANNQLNFISRIEDRDGNVIFQPKPEEAELTDRCIASQMDEILRKVVTHGTGQRARGELYIETPSPEAGKGPLKVRIPAYGKTGTTNDYQTAYFAGFVPYPVQAKAPLSTDNALVIASYVGYDNNRTMRNGGYKISGAYGALPIWSDFAKAYLQIKKYQDFIDTSDIGLMARQEWPMQSDTCTLGVQVDLPRGTVLHDAAKADTDATGFTNIEKEGESFMDEFARNPSVQTVVRLVMDNTTHSAQRFFRPFSLTKEDAEKMKAVSESGGGFVNPNAPQTPNISNDPSHNDAVKPEGGAVAAPSENASVTPPAAANSSLPAADLAKPAANEAAEKPAPSAVGTPEPAVTTPKKEEPATKPKTNTDKGYIEEELW